MLSIENPYSATELEATITGCANSDDAIKYQEVSSTHRLVLNTFRGWDGDVAEFVKAFRGVQVLKLSIFGVPHVDISGLKVLNSLRELNVAGLVNGELNLDFFPELASFGLGAELKGINKIILKWGGGLNLQYIGGLGSKMPNIEQLIKFKNLQSLSVVKPTWEPEELQRIERLIDLDMTYWRKIESLSQLGSLKNVLRKLNLYQASKISDYSDIVKMSSLQRLCLHKCPDFPSVKLVINLSLLSEFLLIDTKIIDGDISSLMEMKNLKRVAFAKFKHYSPSCETIESFFESKFLIARSQ